ncbi:patatin-like phospholipase family protein [Rhodobacteraceae bacterium]|nr:patatin-like phospholipase family protein [Paracoccaceae bacterium]
MMRTSIMFTLISAMVLSSCGTVRPPIAGCGVQVAMPDVGQSLSDPLESPPDAPIAEGMANFSMADAFRDAVETAPQAAGSGPVTVEILALSAGGQFGAFGAGFMRGWAENPVTPRPVFRLVTGVSAGAMIAPIVFAGTNFDEALDGYRGLSEADVFRRKPLTSLISAPSFADVTPLEAFVTSRMSDELINSIGRNYEEGRGLFILATDLDTTEAAVFNLGDIAASSRPLEQKRDCIREAMLASAAIPGLFPPRNIDGSLFADGGLRDQIFLESIEEARQETIRKTGRNIRVSATIVINGSLRPPETEVRDGLLSYAKRAASILADEVLRDSISEVVTFAQSQPNWTVRGMIADTDLSQCPVEDLEGTFDPCVTQSIFDDGRQKARLPRIPWLGPDELLELAGRL